MRVGVVGVGVVGSALADNLEAHGHEVMRWDPDKGYRDLVRGSQVIFVCVYDEGDMKLLEHVVSQYVGLGAHVVIKTTCLPGTTERLSEKYGPLTYCPEFLDADTAHEDFARQGYVVLGSTDIHAIGALMDLMEPFANRFLVMAPTEAEILKLAQNTFYALKVTFANEVADLCEAHGARYGPVRDGLYSARYIAPNHLDVDHKGYRGFGGACLPKDTKMFRDAGHTPLADLVDGLNKKRRAC